MWDEDDSRAVNRGIDQLCAAAFMLTVFVVLVSAAVDAFSPPRDFGPFTRQFYGTKLTQHQAPEPDCGE